MSEIALAVGLGALSAVSLPLGAITARFWQPANRMLGILTARGGFLRKASTTLVYAEQRERRRRRRLLEHLERVELLDGLPDRELDLLAEAGRIVAYPQHRLIYGSADPAETLRVVVRGAVRLDHDDGEDARTLAEHAVFGFRSFLAGTPHRSSAVAAADPTDVLEIPRARFLEVLDQAGRLRERLEAYLASDPVLDDLRDQHGLSAPQLDDWVARVRTDAGHGTVRAREAPHPGADFVERAGELRRAPVFEGLYTEELQRIGDRLLRKQHDQGHSFFGPGDAPDRLYVIEPGRVSLVTKGGPHVATAVTTTAVTVWARRAMRSVTAARPAPEVRATAADHAAPLAIWLGLMLDGIPESFVIGAEATAAVGGTSLIAGLFLSNYPEALSSSVGMREQGWAWRRILLLWTSLLAAAATGAGIGAVVVAGASEAVSAGIRGVATGAMITVIAETMLPEAFARSGSASGLAALAGFLVTILVGA